MEQLSRYLKINNLHDKLAKTEYCMKVEPLLFTMRKAGRELILLLSDVNIDDSLIAAQVTITHLIQIDCKAAGRCYKIYTLACGSYLYGLDLYIEDSKSP